MNDSNDSYWINGIKVYFPLKPYNTQISAMSQIISALNKSKNCLVESPTGTGKTLALLCSSLAWLHDFNLKNEKNRYNHLDIKNDEPDYNLPVVSEYFDDDFVENSTVKIAKNKAGKKGAIDDEKPGDKRARIFYCTRTHRQIAQVVAELKRTKYSEMFKMSVLSSRKLSCLNTKALKSASVTDSCRQLISKTRPFYDRCHYFQNVNLTDTHKKLKMAHCDNTWNLEEFISICQEKNSCPYFSAQKLTEKAEIIFAPYNYVMNPVISESMSLDLDNSVIILDEAHNVEDICRSSMSACFSQSNLLSCYKELNTISNCLVSEKASSLKESYDTVNGVLSSFSNWMKSYEDTLDQVSSSMAQKIFSGLECKHSIENFMGIDGSTFSDSHLKRINESFSKDEFSDIPQPSEACNHMITSVFLLLDYILVKDASFFTVSITKGASDEFDGSQTNFMLNQNAEDKKSKPTSNILNELRVNFICLSPSLAFSHVTSKCRSVILASGTLSPMNSFAPELGVPFDVTFQTANYLQPGQAVVYALGVDPRNRDLELTYSHVSTLALQDEVGKIILEICQIVVGGVLCFFPSYIVMDKFSKRWELTGCVQKLNQCKQLFFERRGMSTSDVDQMIESYFKACRLTEKSKGAALFAVCRGRISEGIDFRDNRARAVITLGIPYPNIKTLDIAKKMSFNDDARKNSSTTNMLTGREWYNTQAFRALNQALGRCIRHRDDWGAIIMIDKRLTFPDEKPNGNYLSNWIRKNTLSFTNFESFKHSLKDFFENKKHLCVLENVEKQNENRNPSIWGQKIKKSSSQSLNKFYIGTADSEKENTLGFYKKNRKRPQK